MAKNINSFLCDDNSVFWKNTNLDDLPNEIWVDAFSFDGNYEVSSLGRVKSIGRYVPHRNTEMWVKERIRKQVLVKDGRLSCNLNQDGIGYTINLPVLIYQSFFLKESWNARKKCVMHKNKCQQDNRIENLKIETISNSHTLNNKKGLLPHLYKNNQKKKEDYLKLTHKICGCCGIEKQISEFEYGRNKCLECRKIYKKALYKKTKAKSD